MRVQTATLGYLPIGKKREVKKALEAFWRGSYLVKNRVAAARLLPQEISSQSVS
ncbi:hypothetical protein [Moorena producens]|uniref:hypothetical protein n=1 Tax=Moorena producens TaxID=1155739 RepID=UPI0011EA641D|nr:hypothetical protein [Moorena producens]